MNNFDGIPIGLSDHTVNNLSSYTAIALGACIMKGITLTIWTGIALIICSMDENSCKELIANSIKIKSMLGGIKEPAKEEEVITCIFYCSKY